MRTPAVALVACVAVTALACNSDNSTGPENRARVQVVNASTGTATTNTMIGSQTVATGTAFGASNASCVLVPTGTQTVTFSSGGTNVATANADFRAGQRYTIVLTGTGATRAALVLPESTFTSATAGNNGIRFVNATGTAGDVWVTTPGGALSGNASVGNLAAGAATGGTTGVDAYGMYPIANTQVRFFDVGTTTGTPRSNITVGSLPTTSRGTTVIFTEPTGTSGTTNAVQVNGCT